MEVVVLMLMLELNEYNKEQLEIDVDHTKLIDKK